MNRAGKILRIGLLVFFVLLWRNHVHHRLTTVHWPEEASLDQSAIRKTPERVARSRYLTQGLLGCESCHSLQGKESTKHGAPNVAGMELAGQVLPILDLPGSITAANLTPDNDTGGLWTDDQYARAIREGIGHDGRTIRPMILQDL